MPLISKWTTYPFPTLTKRYIVGPLTSDPDHEVIVKWCVWFLKYMQINKDFGKKQCTGYLPMYIDNKFDVSWIYKKGIHAEVYITRAFTCKYKQHFFNKQYTKDLFYEIKMVRKFIYIKCYDWIIYLVKPISKEKNNATNSLSSQAYIICTQKATDTSTRMKCRHLYLTYEKQVELYTKGIRWFRIILFWCLCKQIICRKCLNKLNTNSQHLFTLEL